MEDNVKNEIVIYQNESGQIECKVNLHDKTIWLSLDQISNVFKKNKSTISRHIKNIFDSEELERDSVVAKLATTANDGKTYNVDFALTLLIAESNPTEMETIKNVVVSVLNGGVNG